MIYRMKVFITGAPGTGKTTIVKRLFSLRPDIFTGFWTEEMREGKRRVGFKIVRTDGKSGILSHVDIKSSMKVGKYSVNLEEFERLVLPVLRKASKIILIDEIGKMELFSKKFQDAVEKLVFYENVKMIATIPLKDVHPLVRRIRKKFNPVELTMTNREKVFEDIEKVVARFL